MLCRSASFQMCEVRQFSTSVARQGGDIPGGIPGNNLPFDIHNPTKLAFLFIVFFGSAFGLPFFMVRHQLMKNHLETPFSFGEAWILMILGTIWKRRSPLEKPG
ncbi:unnamed protein product [Cyprideis torosa]|uniref:Cytochrome c oxidase subunit 7C, mitochondrial n=1 Tax=Cyprideis torosa TaxID=163714 RepID=A0A7R8W8C0_9CRUS|nr:unnamed protein product [Cyprideis torosa]CAG0888433.1 unnamed protein product [Cyprideis torosa]